MSNWTDRRRLPTENATDAYGVALLLLVFSIVLLITFGDSLSSWTAAIAVVSQIVALVVTMRVSGIKTSMLNVMIGVSVMMTAAGVAGAVIGGRMGAVVAHAGWLVLAGMAIWSITHRLMGYHHVTMPFVLGLLCIYLLLGLMFGLAIGIANALDPPALRPEEYSIAQAVYFSFITITTVGFGDYTPASESVRALAVLEAITGQLYLVSVVSLAVGRFGGRVLGRNSQEEEEE